MALVKASETDFCFPVFAFVQGGEHTGFPDIWALITYHRDALQEDIYTGMELIDADGRRG